MLIKLVTPGVLQRLVLAILVNLNHCCFKHGGGFGELWRWWEPAQLVHGDSKVGAQCWQDHMPINLDELFVEVVDDTVPSLLIGSTATDSRARIGVCYGCGGICFSMASGAIGISSFSCDLLRVGFPITSSTVG